MAAPIPSMQGKICLVTGATSGIGLVTARALAQQEATVVLVGRNPERTAATVSRLQQETGNPHVECLLADLSAQAQVRQLAGEFQRRFARLDVLLNNAGAFIARRSLSVDGIEMTLALNHLAYFLLTHLLLDTLKATPAARIVNVSSDAHRKAQFDFADPQDEVFLIGHEAFDVRIARLLLQAADRGGRALRVATDEHDRGALLC